MTGARTRRDQDSEDIMDVLMRREGPLTEKKRFFARGDRRKVRPDGQAGPTETGFHHFLQFSRSLAFPQQQSFVSMYWLHSMKLHHMEYSVLLESYYSALYPQSPP